MNHAQTLETIHRLTHRHWTKNTGALGLSYSEFEYLSALKEQELLAAAGQRGQHLHDLVSSMGVNKASASAMMDKFEKRKLIRIKPCKRDKRAKLFLLSKKGEELRVQGKAAYDQVAEALDKELLAIISPTQILPNEQATDEAPARPKKTPTKKKAAPKAKPEENTEQPDALPQLSLFG